ncbi:MAG: hypothetical protein MUF39_03030 [Cyclobacteriaceae bacterium]|nr:hypothetical protein [Cyclobacteriaceae bacterium]
MKSAVRFCVLIGAMIVSLAPVMGQKKIDQDRMLRDIEVTENILSTLIKQQLDKRSFFPMEVAGEYREGLGVTYRLPAEINGPMIWSLGGQMEEIRMMDGKNYVFSFDEQDNLDRAIDEEMRARDRALRTTSRSGNNSYSRKLNADSLRTVTSDKVIEACKTFITDYGDLITQLQASEKIVITNRGEGNRNWYGAFANSIKPSIISVEARKSDITEYKQGKISRDAFVKRMNVVNSVLEDELQPDLELITSIFNRLYRADLSKTFFTEENLYYERMKDYGVIYHMQVYSSNVNSGFMRTDAMIYSMPTLGLEGLTQAERDKKVIEMYPKFEKDIKDDMLEYGRTIKSLKPDEFLIFDIRISKCVNCGIPASLELSIKADILKQYESGKLTKEQALGKMSVKKGPNQ